MPSTRTGDVERRALALLEQVSDRPRSRTRLLRDEAPTVLARLAALEAKAGSAGSLIPTDVPGGIEIEPPDKIGPFRIVRRLGAGGMGSVWLAERSDGLYEQQVAIKLIHGELGVEAAARFSAERRFLARLETPAIARLIDGGMVEGRPYLIMEYVDGETIDTAADGRPLAERVALFTTAAEAVQYAHGQLVVHADLKWSNILVDRSGRVRLLDFGVSRLVGADDETDVAGPMTADFASPERQAGGPPSIADDIYALGVILEELRKGSSDPDLCAIAARAAAPAASDRYRGVAALLADLQRWRERLPVNARPATTGYRVERFLARHALGVGVAAAVMVLLAAAAGVASFNYVRAERARIEADRRFQEVRAISGFMLFELYDRLADAPGTVEARMRLADTARTYLNRLRLSDRAPVDLRLETAQGYRRLARVQGLSGTASLGRPQEALRSLDAAEVLAKGVLATAPENPAALELLGWISVDRWSLRPDVSKSAAINAHAADYFRRALARSPDLEGARLGLLTTEKSRGYDLIWTADRPAEAIPILNAALADLRARPLKTRADEASLLEVNLLNRLGDAVYYAGNVPASLGPFREAAAIIDARLARGETLEWLSRKGESAFNISGTLGDTGSEREALAEARQGIAVMRRVLSFGPDANAEKRLLVLYGQEAGMLSALGDNAAALKPADASLALREARLRLAPGDPQRLRDLAVGLEANARRYAAAGRQDDACGLSRRSDQTWRRIQADGRLGQRDLNETWPKARDAVSRFCGPPA